MLANVGEGDRVVRVVLGMALLILIPGSWSWIGLVPLLSGSAGYCPVYDVFGWSSQDEERSA